jgi:2-methylisocitrate lyase-like PEP mutase family enzyme
MPCRGRAQAAIIRAVAALAGADMIFPDDDRFGHVQKFSHAVKCPSSPTSLSSGPPLYSVQELRDAKFPRALSLSAFRAMSKAALAVMEQYAMTGPKNIVNQMQSRADHILPRLPYL